MYKVVGILCILAGCAGFGNLKVRQEKDRIRHLRAFIHIMRRIQNEISYGKHTVPEICLIIADLKETWKEQMEACLRELPLQAEEKEAIMNLPVFLGLQEENRQAMGLEQSVELLTRKCRQAEEAYDNRAKMIHSVSILAGLLLSILLL